MGVPSPSQTARIHRRQNNPKGPVHRECDRLRAQLHRKALIQPKGILEEETSRKVKDLVISPLHVHPSSTASRQHTAAVSSSLQPLPVRQTADSTHLHQQDYSDLDPPSTHPPPYSQTVAPTASAGYAAHYQLDQEVPPPRSFPPEQIQRISLAGLPAHTRTHLVAPPDYVLYHQQTMAHAFQPDAQYNDPLHPQTHQDPAVYPPVPVQADKSSFKKKRKRNARRRNYGMILALSSN